MRGRPKENRVRLTAHVLPATATRIKKKATGSTIGRVIDEKFSKGKKDKLSIDDSGT